jgi:hypothetical protein
VTVAGVFSVAAPAAAQPHTATCIGTATLGPPTNYTSSERGGVKIERFDFTGVHDLCLADGTVVVATLAGHLTQVTRDDGSGSIFVRQTMSIPTGSLESIVRVRFSPTSFDANALVFGGTGELAGISGHGTTAPTGPNTFLSRVVYRYP